MAEPTTRSPLVIESMLVCREHGEWVSEDHPEGTLSCAMGHTVTEDEAQTVYPCRVCGYAFKCGEPPGEDCY